MSDILQEIIAHKHDELTQMRAKKPSLRQALLDSESGIIAEFKRKSPSKGWIKEEGRADLIPLSYQQNGAAALSILTDKKFFGGNDDFIRQARQSGVTIPVLYKNFVIDEFQLYEAALCGASAVLLIAACLSRSLCGNLIEKAHSIGLEVLLEMHSEAELEYADLGPDLCGINNRNLGSFITDVENSFRLAERLPKEAVKVSESGISDPATVRALRQAGFRGFLIGENFMKTSDPGLSLRDFIAKLGIDN
ncbi:MAG: indole-3-glycerol phosphate synthase TrpC [Prevotella sp.]|nr:indole-3-glycerol phosphate synthase TrpC [Prevotella sp.]